MTACCRTGLKHIELGPEMQKSTSRRERLGESQPVDPEQGCAELTVVYWAPFLWPKTNQSPHVLFNELYIYIINIFCDYVFYLQSIRMANLSIVGSHAVNGVSKLHLDTLKMNTFKVWINHANHFTVLITLADFEIIKQ